MNDDINSQFSIVHSQLKKYLFFLILVSTVIRAIIAYTVELGNDEVYYRTFALYHGYSHYDYPPMVVWIIQLFSLDFHFHSDFIIRLAAIIFCSINTYLIFLIGKKVKDELTGFYAALLYTASIYCFVISGTFILPDSPLLFFWLLSIYFLVNSISQLKPKKSEVRYVDLELLLAGLFIGLALLSKYQSAFLWLGTFIYIIFYNRSWLKSKTLYISLLFSIVLFLPVIVWNFYIHLISYSYQRDSLDIFHYTLHPEYFKKDLLGTIFYNNPFNFFIEVIALIALFKGRNFIQKKYSALLLSVSLPLIFIVIVYSFFNLTSPHWTGPAYISFIIISAAWLSARKHKVLIPNIIKFSLSFTLLTVILGFVEINYDILNLKNNNITELVKNDFSHDMYGWKQLQEKFSHIIAKQHNNDMNVDAHIVSNNLFSAAHLDYYVANSLHKKLFVIGDLSNIHEYNGINNQFENSQKGSDAWFITMSPDHFNPKVYFINKYHAIIPSDIIPIIRNNIAVKYAFVYKLKNFL